MENQVQEVKSRIDIVELIRSYIPLQKGGKNFKALCPFHNEHTPSFMVSSQLQSFKCFGCNKSGDAITFIEEIEGVEFPEALRMLAERAGIKLKEVKEAPEQSRKQKLFEINHLAEEYFNFLLTKHKFGKVALDYLKNRGLKEETIKVFGIGYSPNSWDSLGNFLLKKGYFLEDIVASGLAITKEGGRHFYDRFRGRVMFPYRDSQGRTIGFSARILEAEKDQPKYINTPQTPIYDKGSSLYGIDLGKTEIKKADEAIVVEGQMDMISPFQAGVKNIVAAGGTSLTQNQLRVLLRYSKNLALCFDTDFAGDSASQRGIEVAEELEMNIRVVTLPKEFKDADEVVKKDPEIFKKAIEEAKPINDFYFDSALSRYNQKTALGKKQIGEFLIPKIGKIKNEIEKNHYIKWLADEIETGEEIIYKELTGKAEKKDEREKISPNNPFLDPSYKKANLEEYMISLLLKAPLEETQRVIYKIGQNDFSETSILNIFTELKGYVEGRSRKIEMEILRKKLTEEAQKKLDDLWMSSLGDLEEDGFEDNLKKELDNSFNLLKQKTQKREMTEISRKIKEAEKEGNEEKLKELQKEFNSLSEKLK